MTKNHTLSIIFIVLSSLAVFVLLDFASFLTMHEYIDYCKDQLDFLSNKFYSVSFLLILLAMYPTVVRSVGLCNRSIFRIQENKNFTLTKDGKKYDCKLLASVFALAQIVIDDNGFGLRQFTLKISNLKLINIVSRLDCTVEGDGSKVLILVPAPKQNDTGEKIGEYTVYHSSGFLGAVEHDTLNVKPQHSNY